MYLRGQAGTAWPVLCSELRYQLLPLSSQARAEADKQRHKEEVEAAGPEAIAAAAAAKKAKQQQPKKEKAVTAFQVSFLTAACSD